MPNFGSLFTGAGCIDQLPIANKYVHTYANEYSQELADVFSANYNHPIVVKDIFDTVFPDIQLDWLHASPPCVLHSGARQKKPTLSQIETDIALSHRVYEFAMATKAKFVSIENVPAYYKSQSFFQFHESMSAQKYLCSISKQQASLCGLAQSRSRGFALYFKATQDIPVLVNTLDLNQLGWADAINVNSLPKLVCKDGAYPKPLAMIEACYTKNAKYPIAMPCVTFSNQDRARSGIDVLATIKAAVCDDYKSKKGRKNFMIVKAGDDDYRTMTADAIKVVQGFHKDFKIPENNRVAMRAIGNACPPQMLASAINQLICFDQAGIPLATNWMAAV